ncbi:MAG TPA: hypothetical protein VE818_06660 [Nitrososphaeraceae archaeon]|jgi:hypothetical protein|nr:hypothetical protein [Nitrososphaeraceae archaeon]
MINKKTRKIDDPNDYKESGIKDTMEDLQNTTKAALDSAPELSKEQVTHGNDTSKELLYGGSNDNNKNKKRCL